MKGERIEILVERIEQTTRVTFSEISSKKTQSSVFDRILTLEDERRGR